MAKPIQTKICTLHKKKQHFFFHKLLFREFEQFQHGLHISQPTRPFYFQIFHSSRGSSKEWSSDHQIEEKWDMYMLSTKTCLHKLSPGPADVYSGFSQQWLWLCFHYVVNTSPNTAADRTQLTQHFFSGYSRGGISSCNLSKGRISCFAFFLVTVPIGSMDGIFTYIYHKNKLNVGEYTIHGWYGVSFSVCCLFWEE